MSCGVELSQSFLDLPCWLKHSFVWIHDQQTLITGLLALAAAIFTIRQVRQQIEQQSKIAETERQISHNTLLQSAMLKSFQVSDGILRSLRHFEEINRAHPDHPKDRFWEIYQPTVRSKSLPEKIKGEELSAFIKSKKSDLIMPMLELERVLEMDEDMSSRYEGIRKEFEQLMAASTKFSLEDGKLVGTNTFDANQHPLTIGKILEMTQLLEMQKGLLNDNFEKAKKLMNDLTEFSKDAKLGAKFALPDRENLLGDLESTP